MRPGRIELMHEHVRAVHRAVTGRELPEPVGDGSASFDEVSRRFTELQMAARAIPSLDVIGTERELVVELAVAGVERSDVVVELFDGELIVCGARSGAAPREGRVYLHAEIARGPFWRALPVPDTAAAPPRVEVENGIIRVKLARISRAPLPRA